MHFHDALKYRYATKKFDRSKGLERSVLNACLESARLAPSSYGLQPYRYLVISDRSIRDKLSPVCYGQPQILDSAFLIIGQARKMIDEDFINQYIAEIAVQRNQSIESLNAYRDIMIAQIAQGKTPSEQLTWAQHQLYLSAGIFIAHAASEKIDVCPMEGFSQKGVDAVINGLSDSLYQSTLILAAGYRDHSDPYLQLKKFRRPFERFVQEITI